MKPTPQQVQAIIDESRNGINQCFSHFTRSLTFSDGVHDLAQAAGAFWLIDLVASYQHKCRKDPMLCDFQIWILKTNTQDRTADAYCFKDSNNGTFDFAHPAIHQHIPNTDFPVPFVKFYVEQGGPGGKPLLMFPSER